MHYAVSYAFFPVHSKLGIGNPHQAHQRTTIEKSLSFRNNSTYRFVDTIFVQQIAARDHQPRPIAKTI
jgi:hypothetical protein